MVCIDTLWELFVEMCDITPEGLIMPMMSEAIKSVLPGKLSHMTVER